MSANPENNFFLGDIDLHLLGEGNHLRSYERFGAHLRKVGLKSGVNFAVWAPNAKFVSVIGDFNSWNADAHPLMSRGDSGVWEGFVPAVGVATCYKFFIRSQYGNQTIEKADPYAFSSEVRPRSASVVADLAGFEWTDAPWMRSRAVANGLKSPVSVYEVHLGSWRRHVEENRWLTYRELAEVLPPYVADMGFTHVELLPIMEHPFDGSWGYQTIGYFAPTSRFGSPHDFMSLVDAFHRHGIGVILDWTPAHFPKDGHGLGRFDGTALYEHADPREGEHSDWGTLIFNYGRREVANFLLANALFWFDKYHIDGLRVDAVASMLYRDYSRKSGEWVPNKFGGRENIEAIDFLRKLNETAYSNFPDIMMVAEESTSWPMVSRPIYVGGLGFGYKWNMGWMNDTLRYIAREPLYRSFHQNELTFGLLYAFHENFVLPFSHDEVVHGKASMLSKMPGDVWQKFANLRLLYGFMFGHPGKKLLFMGAELGQWDEWNYAKSLDWHLLDGPAHRGLQSWVRDLNTLIKREPSLHQLDFDSAGFKWVDCNDHAASVLSFLRRGSDGTRDILCVCNFTPVVRQDYVIGVSEEGYWEELLNSDADVYGGSGVGNVGGVWTQASESHGYSASIRLTLPPLAVLFLRRKES